jgi:adenylylsulfate kinase-like enzyme
MTGGSDDLSAGGVTPEPGWVVWITGLSGSGKTMAAERLLPLVRACHPATVLLDGDELRAALPCASGYSVEERRRWARSYAKLAALLARQGVHVIVATISLFADVRRSNRAEMTRYFEVYLRAPLDVLRARDRRGVYRGENVVGVDISAELPSDPDLICETDASDAAHVAQEIWRALSPRMAVAR